MDQQVNKYQSKSLIYAVCGGLLSMSFIMVGYFASKWSAVEFTTESGVECEKVMLGDWECNMPPLNTDKVVHTSLQSDRQWRESTEITSDQELKALLDSDHYKKFNHVPKVRSYINEAKNDGKITVSELSTINQLIQAEHNKIANLSTARLVNQL